VRLVEKPKQIEPMLVTVIPHSSTGRSPICVHIRQSRPDLCTYKTVKAHMRQSRQSVYIQDSQGEEDRPHDRDRHPEQQHWPQPNLCCQCG